MHPIYVAVGGALGTLARFGLGTLAAREDSVLPWPTLIVNVIGSYALGFLLSLPAEGELQALLRLGLGVGFCGAFTTFSTFSHESLRLLQQGHTARAAMYIVASVLLSLTAIATGMLSARALSAAS